MLLLKSFIASEFGSVDRAVIKKKKKHPKVFSLFFHFRPQLAERAFTFIVRPFFFYRFLHLNTRTCDELLGPCFKTGRWEAFCQHPRDGPPPGRPTAQKAVTHTPHIWTCLRDVTARVPTELHPLTDSLPRSGVLNMKEAPVVFFVLDERPNSEEQNAKPSRLRPSATLRIDADLPEHRGGHREKALC